MNEEFEFIQSRFGEYLKTLPPALRSAACDRGTYLGTSFVGTEVRTFPDDVSSICTLPLLFSDSIPVAPEAAQEVAYAITIGVLHALLADKIIDRQLAPTAPRILLMASLVAEYFRVLESLLRPYPGFWRLHRRYLRQYRSAELAHPHLDHAGPLDLRRYEKIARAKSAPLKVSAAALAFLAHEPSLAAPYTASIDHFLVGFQLYDDVVDWKEDYEQKRITPVSARVVALCESQHLTGENGRGQVELFVHGSDVLETTLDRSSWHYERALQCVADRPGLRWPSFLRSMIDANKALTAALVQRKAEAIFGKAGMGLTAD